MRTGRVAAALLAVITFLVSCRQEESTDKPKLILILSIDQMRYDYLTRFSELFRGGLQTLLTQGAVFSNARYRHAVTSTGPGHAVIASGRHPSHSGIIENGWYDSRLKKTVGVVEDPSHSLLPGRGSGASPVHFIGDTFGDVLKQNSSESRVVAVSLKDRSAILMAGPRGDAAYWYDPATGNFVTSTYYMDQPPVWLQSWNDQGLADRYGGKRWERLIEDEELYERYAGPDHIEGEWDRQDTVFPHLIRGAPPDSDFYLYLRRTPFIDELTLSVTLEAFRQHELGIDASADILAIGFSGTDIVGHTYGTESQELMDQMLRLDLFLEELFEQLDATVGLGDTLVVLTSDHGSLPLVETLQAKGIDAVRASPEVLETAVAQALKSRFPEANNLIASFSASGVYFDEEIIQEYRLKRREVEAEAARALLSTGLVEAVYTHSQLLDSQATDDPHIELFRNSFFQPRSPHLMVLPKKYAYIDRRVGGTGHGTAHDYDRHIPIIFMGAGIEPGLYPGDCGPEDIAPTIAKMLGFEYPREEDSRLLLEMLPAPPRLAPPDSN